VTVRVRIAPSPTGNLHIGTARTALFNWLFARHHGGEFILRIEDTDQERSRPEFTENIITGLRWLGLNWDIGPIWQTQRRHRYQEVIEQLLAQKLAYRSYETEAELQAMRQAQEAQKQAPRYNNQHRDLTPEQEAEFLAQGRQPVIRFRIDDQREICWHDLIRGEMRWQGSDLGGDMVIARADGQPLYNFAVVVDDVMTAGRLTDSERVLAQTNVVNVYSSRHYDSDKDLFRRFTQATGIRVNVLEGPDDQLIERIRSEGNNSPADILFTVDAGRLWRAQEAGIFQPVNSPILTRSIPSAVREPGNHWFGFTRRARVIMYHKDRVKPNEISTYEELADPKWRGQVLIRSSRNVYNQSLVGALIRHIGQARTEKWAQGVAQNLARPPQGGDTDQIRALAAGAGNLAVSNTYYLARLLKSPKPEDRELAQKIGIIFPNQNSWGTHVNISGAGMLKTAPNRANAQRFLEFLASREAQEALAKGNNEYPVVAGVPIDPVVASFGTFKSDPLNASVFGRNNALALKITDRAGWA